MCMVVKVQICKLQSVMLQMCDTVFVRSSSESMNTAPERAARVSADLLPDSCVTGIRGRDGRED